MDTSAHFRVSTIDIAEIGARSPARKPRTAIAVDFVDSRAPCFCSFFHKIETVQKPEIACHVIKHPGAFYL